MSFNDFMQGVEAVVPKDNTAEASTQTTTEAAETTAQETTETTPVVETTAEAPIIENTTPESNVVTATETKIEAEVKNANVFATEEVARFNSFALKYPTKSFSDFKTLTTPTNELKPEELLRNYYSEKEGMSETEIAYELEKLGITQNPDDLDPDFVDDLSPTEKLRVAAEKEKAMRLAANWHTDFLNGISDSTKQEQSESTPISVEQQMQKLQDDYQELVKGNVEEVYRVLPTLTSIEMDINGQKVNFTPDESFGKEGRLIGGDVNVLMSKFFDQTGKLTDASGYMKNLYWTHEPTRNAMLKFAMDEAVKQDRLAQSRERRNVSAENTNAIDTDTTVDKEAAFDNYLKQSSAY